MERLVKTEPDCPQISTVLGWEVIHTSCSTRKFTDTRIIFFPHYTSGHTLPQVALCSKGIEQPSVTGTSLNEGSGLDDFQQPHPICTILWLKLGKLFPCGKDWYTSGLSRTGWWLTVFGIYLFFKYPLCSIEMLYHVVKPYLPMWCFFIYI